MRSSASVLFFELKFCRKFLYLTHFTNDETIVFAYPLTEHAMFSLKTMVTTDITSPAATTATGMGARTGDSPVK